jgi:hypothetical protein
MSYTALSPLPELSSFLLHPAQRALRLPRMAEVAVSWKMFVDILSLISQLRAPLWHDSAWRSDTSGDGVISAFRSRAKQRFLAPQRSIGRLDRLLRFAIYHRPRAMLAPRVAFRRRVDQLREPAAPGAAHAPS